MITYLESRSGSHQRFNFLKVVFAYPGVLGGLLQMATGLFWPEHFGQSVVGASAGGFGLLAAYCALFSQRQLRHVFAHRASRQHDAMGEHPPPPCWVFSRNGLVAHCARIWKSILTGLVYVRLCFALQKPLVLWRPLRPARRLWSTSVRGNPNSEAGRLKPPRTATAEFITQGSRSHPGQNFRAWHSEPDGTRTPDPRGGA